MTAPEPLASKSAVTTQSVVRDIFQFLIPCSDELDHCPWLVTHDDQKCFFLPDDLDGERIFDVGATSTCSKT
jgi:hypothetical protein